VVGRVAGKSDGFVSGNCIKSGQPDGVSVRDDSRLSGRWFGSWFENSLGCWIESDSRNTPAMQRYRFYLRWQAESRLKKSHRSKELRWLVVASRVERFFLEFVAQVDIDAQLLGAVVVAERRFQRPEHTVHAVGDAIAEGGVLLEQILDFVGTQGIVGCG